MAGKAARTARARKGPSAPARYLVENGLVPEGARVLDYGCGKGADVEAYGWHGWDPNHRPEADIEEAYEFVVCNYVANVLDALERRHLYWSILDMLTEGGEAWIAVRRDKPPEASGYTGIGTFQDFGVDVVQEAPEGALAEHWTTAGGSFALYRLTHSSNPEG